MAVFPESPLPIYPVIFEPEWGNLVSEFDCGAEQRRQTWTFPKYNVSLQYNALSATNQQILWAFYMARKGTNEAFYFFDPAPPMGIYTSYLRQYVGVGTGAQATFDLPGKSTSIRTLYVNGGVVVAGFSYLTGGGEGSADRVQFDVAPAAGYVITVDFTGQLRIRCRFAADKLSREWFMTVLFNYGIQLKGLNPA